MSINMMKATYTTTSTGFKLTHRLFSSAQLLVSID
jgi:hypothetical protein